MGSESTTTLKTEKYSLFARNAAQTSLILALKMILSKCLSANQNVNDHSDPYQMQIMLTRANSRQKSQSCLANSNEHDAEVWERLRRRAT